MKEFVKNKKILIIEDEPPLLNALADKFEREGFLVIKAVNGEEGLSLSLQERPAFIILDIVMPKMDGLTMLKKLREDEWGKYVPVIVLTNLTGDREATAALENLAYDFLVKSDCKLEDLVKIVKEKLRA